MLKALEKSVVEGKKMNETPRWVKNLGVLVLGLGSGHLLDFYFSANVIPNANKVQQGFIAPSKLEVKLTDLDKNGQPETVLKIGDKQYLLRDVEGQPVLSEYTLKPAEPAQIQYGPAEEKWQK